MKYLKRFNESVETGVDYEETVWQMDKYMPEDSEIQDEYYDILNASAEDEDKASALEDFFQTHMDEEAFQNYLPEGGDLKGFCQYLANKY